MAPSVSRSAPARSHARSSHAHAHAHAHVPPFVHPPPEIDAELRGALAELRPRLVELLSLWPRDRHDRLVLWASVDARGETVIGARLREHDFEFGPDLARELRRIRGDVPVVIELRSGRVAVVPWRSLL